MPIYEYKCKKCGDVFETFVLRHDERVKCPKCGSEEPEKLISATNIGTSGGGCHAGCDCGHSHTPGFS